MAGILVVGFVFMDIKGFPSDTYRPKLRNKGTIEFHDGGVSRNVAVNIANTGKKAAFCSLYEASGFGRDIKENLDRIGIDTSGMQCVPAGKTGIGKWMVILDENGNVAGELSCPPDASLLEETMHSMGDALVCACDSIVLELDTSESLDECVLSLAKKYGKKVYTVVGNRSIIEKRHDFVAALNCFVCNEAEAGSLFGVTVDKTKPQEALALLKSHIGMLGCPAMCMTLGEVGSVYYDARTGEEGFCPAIPTQLVDSTGAGDAFLSGIVMGLTAGISLQEAVCAGTRLASLVIRSEESAIPPVRNFWGNQCK